MVRVTEMIKSKFLKKDDIPNERNLTISGCSLQTMPGFDAEERWVLTFRELAKGLPLNDTTIRVLGKAYGSDSDEWVGRTVCLYVDHSVEFKGQIVGGLRLRPILQPKGAASPAEKDPDDDMPF